MELVGSPSVDLCVVIFIDVVVRRFAAGRG